MGGLVQFEDFKGGGGLDEKEEVMFLGGLIPCTHMMVTVSLNRIKYLTKGCQVAH